jgi:cytochrome b subunit of formate dehydrogenase
MIKATNPENRVERFSVLHRFLHLVVMIGFIGLAVTGLSLAFGSQPWARAVVWVLGGTQNVGGLHRFLAVVTYACLVAHVIWFLYFKLLLQGRWRGPHSLLPGMQDLRDLRHHLSYFFGFRNSPPRFNKFTYVEKVDYWAFFIGMNTMGITGIFLWHPETASRFLPGYFVNLAQILHLYEAILAVTIKFVSHVAINHLRPSVYPMDKSIFVGYTDKETMMTEHPGQWASLAEQAEAPPPPSNEPPFKAKELGIP